MYVYYVQIGHRCRLIGYYNRHVVFISIYNVVIFGFFSISTISVCYLPHFMTPGQWEEPSDFIGQSNFILLQVCTEPAVRESDSHLPGLLKYNI